MVAYAAQAAVMVRQAINIAATLLYLKDDCENTPCTADTSAPGSPASPSASSDQDANNPWWKIGLSDFGIPDETDGGQTDYGQALADLGDQSTNWWNTILKWANASILTDDPYYGSNPHWNTSYQPVKTYQAKDLSGQTTGGRLWEGEWVNDCNVYVWSGAVPADQTDRRAGHPGIAVGRGSQSVRSVSKPSSVPADGQTNAV